MKKILTVIGFLIIGINLVAEVKISVDAPSLVAVGEAFNVKFIIEDETEVKSLDVDFHQSDFNLIWGPQKSSSTNVSYINGKMSKKSSCTYTYMLSLDKVGKFQIPEASIVVNGNTYKSKAKSIEAIENASNKDSNIKKSSNHGQQSIGTNIFLTMELSKTKVVLGEYIIANLKLYKQADITSIDHANFPKFNGFWSHELHRPSNIDFVRTKYNNEIYDMALIASYILIPQQKGDIVISPAQISLQVLDSNANNDDIFSIFDVNYKTISKTISSKKTIIKVSDLAAPRDYQGAVGDFSISSKFLNPELKMHEANALIITIKGDGNLPLLQAPRLTFPSDFELYDVKVTAKNDEENNPTKGSISFEYPFIPRIDGDFEIPALSYKYYSPKEKKFKELTLEAQTLRVLASNIKNNGPGTNTLDNRVQKATIKVIDEDIRYISSSYGKLKKQDLLLISSWGYILSIFAVIIGYVVVAISLFYFRKRDEDIVLSKNRKAVKLAQAKLKKAKQYLSQGEKPLFYGEIHRALMQYICDKLNVEMADFNKEYLQELFTRYGLEATVIQDFLNLLNDCEFARYFPATGSGDMEQNYNKAIDLISQIEASMKNKNIKIKSFSLVIAFFLLSSISSFAQNQMDSLWQKGVNAYSQGKWTESLESFQEIEKQGYKSEELYYNIANAYYKLFVKEKAILYYERALKLNPAYEDARYNLELVNQKIVDKIIPVPEFVLKTWLRHLSWSLSSDVWAILSLISLLIIAIAVLFILFSNKKSYKILSLYAVIIFLILGFSSLSFSLWQRSEYLNDNYFIVMSTVAKVKTAPSESIAKDFMVLHLGTKVKVLEDLGTWKKIRIADGREGWISSEKIEKI